MAGSATPPNRSYLWTARSGPSAMTLDAYSSSDDEADDAATFQKKPKTQPKPIPRSAGYGAFLATSLNLPRSTKALLQASVAFGGRKLLQEHGDTEKYVVGQVLGWMMAAVYMGGRIPQIYLNIKRGSVEGLNPLMFIFALIANVTYVGSILIRSTEWDKIKANLPWLLDAIVCVGLDLFVSKAMRIGILFACLIATPSIKFNIHSEINCGVLNFLESKGLGNITNLPITEYKSKLTTLFLKC